jgi:hypothetical protein
LIETLPQAKKKPNPELFKKTGQKGGPVNRVGMATLVQTDERDLKRGHLEELVQKWKMISEGGAVEAEV